MILLLSTVLGIVLAVRSAGKVKVPPDPTYKANSPPLPFLIHIKQGFAESHRHYLHTQRKVSPSPAGLGTATSREGSALAIISFDGQVY